MFVKLLMDTDSTQRGRMSERVQVEVEEEVATLPEPHELASSVHYRSVVERKQACNRWLVAYTLLRNPSLQELTAKRIREKKGQEEMVQDGMNHEEQSKHHSTPRSSASRADDRVALMFTNGGSNLGN